MSISVIEFFCQNLNFLFQYLLIGGDDGTSNLASVEMYNAKTDTWTVLAANMTIGRSYTGVSVIDKPSFL